MENLHSRLNHHNFCPAYTFLFQKVFREGEKNEKNTETDWPFGFGNDDVIVCGMLVAEYGSKAVKQ